ncbi:MAG: hypothetical protein ACRCS8_02635 [Brevinema sp.]
MYTHLKNFVRVIEARIPKHIKEVAELRLMWAEIVGENMSKRSQVEKCDFVPIKDENGKPTSKTYKRLRVLVPDSSTKLAMTELSAEFLERIPPKYHIHSLEIRMVSFKDIKLDLPEKKELKKPELIISDEQKAEIKSRVNKLKLSPEIDEAVFDFLCLCQSQKNKAQK